MSEFGGKLVTDQGRHAELYKKEFGKLYEDASYSAQTYYEASKGADFFGRAIVYVPALLAAVASLLIILGYSKNWGVVGVAAGIISATSSFLGAGRKAASFRQSGNSFTKIRHEARMWRDTLVEVRPEAETLEALQKLRISYNEVVETIDLPANYFFRKAGRRISKQVLHYDVVPSPGTGLDPGTSNDKAALSS